ncbi:PAS domain-containing protein [Novosphingobium sp. 9U]|uniref:PAS domain-containing protein n=1 Tax=Novosphingobium sp. 9U TaxID=2653158 RepID=UPI0012EF6E3E|nr:PAS domain-containing protein [Novosphingobium sp. 9U]VWX52803.1 Blue-light-activated histidine kinase 1 [Novosphingobium sp. 9U]
MSHDDDVTSSVRPGWNADQSHYNPGGEARGSQLPEDSFFEASGVLFEQAMAQTRMAVCLCDPHQPDIPIVFANRAFRNLTGYEEHEVIGRNCRLLQGPDTDQREVDKIRAALASEDVVVVELLNYRKDGTTFWNALHLGPIYRSDGSLAFFFGSQWDVSEVRAARAEERHARIMARELSHRIKNMFAVISGIVNITGRVRGIPKEAAEINGRIQALGRAYETTLDEAFSGTIEIGPAIRAILAPYDADKERLQFLGNGLRVHFATVSVVGLVLHELAANATKFGAWSQDGGRVEVDWRETKGDDPGKLMVRWREHDGPHIPTPPEERGTGSQIVDRMLRHGGGSMTRQWHSDGLEATIVIPA